MVHRLREVLFNKNMDFSGIINIENENNKKTITAFRIDNVKGSAIKTIVKNINRDVTIYTDEYRVYNSLKKDFNHKQINHSMK